MKPPLSFPFLFHFPFRALFSFSVCPLALSLFFPLVCCRLSLPLLPPSVFLSPPLSRLDCAVKAVIVCLCVISCLNEGRVNEINFSCPYMGIAQIHSIIVGLCVCVCPFAPPPSQKLHTHAFTACEA